MENENISATKRGNGFWGVMTAFVILLMVLTGVLIAERGYKLFTSFGGVQAEKTLPITAEGKVKAVPDTATISIGVISKAKTAKEAQNEAAGKINKVIAFVKAQGVDSKDITTVNNGLNPRTIWDGSKNVDDGYESNQTITVKVRGVNTDQGKKTAEAVNAGAVDNGANSIYGSQFYIDDPDALRQEARLQAIDKAKAKAQELAKAAGIKIGRVISVSEASGSYPIPMYADKAMGMSEGYGGGGAIAPSFEPGQQDITQQMTLVFEIK